MGDGIDRVVTPRRRGRIGREIVAGVPVRTRPDRPWPEPAPAAGAHIVDDGGRCGGGVVPGVRVPTGRARPGTDPAPAVGAHIVEDGGDAVLTERALERAN